MAKRLATIKKDLEKLGYTVIERDDTLVLSQELQEETLTFDDGDGLVFDYAPQICEGNYDCFVNSEIEKATGKDWFWECEYPYTFKLYRA